MKWAVQREVERLQRVRRHYESRRREMEQAIHQHRTRLRELGRQIAELQERIKQEAERPEMVTNSAAQLKIHHRHREQLRTRLAQLKRDQQRVISQLLTHREAMVEIAQRCRLLQTRAETAKAHQEREIQRRLQDTIDTHARIQRQREKTAH
ncbi:MAG: hypothetical protein ACLFWB_00450 [Armatimonadota bacterium]